MEWLMLSTHTLASVSIPGACFIIFLFFLYLKIAAMRPRSPLPPGPPSMPIIGNLLDMPRRSAWLTYKELSRRYGKLVYLGAAGRGFLVVDDANIAVELLEKHSVIFSSRPESTMVNLTGLEWALVFTPYGSLWRRQRRLFWQHFHPGVIHNYFPTIQQGARNLLSRLVISPEKLSEHVRYTLGSSMIKVTYGLDVAKSKDKYLSTLERGMEGFGLLAHEYTPLFEVFPKLSRIPQWLPGAGFLRHLAAARQATYALRDIPWRAAKDNIAQNGAGHSIASAIIEGLTELSTNSAADEEGIAKDVAAVTYAGGIDTVAAQHSALCGFFVAMSLFPEVQRAAQAELDAVVGPDRLPELADREALPYVNSVVKELLRWHSSAPLGCPRMTTEDFKYDGYFIPRNTIVVVNVWSIMNDPEMYPSPERFWPERYLRDGKLNPNVRDPTSIAFGFGRRICPGRYFGDATLFIYIASILHTFRIAPPYDENGDPIHIRPQYTNGFIAHLEDCRCTITPRSASAEALIRASEIGI
ncbi:cytochrome P450 [Ganoderma sinense ZZ0214-1]|uniref:Cytochrome P450 n=1 Tax=Ganoderma sinense ZZ0214-1 TaxID=1077348 RepID=A0A2G8RMD2_9APHY|nr:cytochrome P450 [Ganoderma sinense ZZ0214-1]